MIRIDGFYLYELGHRLHGIQEIRIFPDDNEPPHSSIQCRGFLYPASFALEELMTKSVFRLRNIGGAAQKLKEGLEWAIANCKDAQDDTSYPTTDVIFGDCIFDKPVT